MAGVIVLSDLVQATTADVLQGTRLQTVPAGGFMTFEFQASVNNTTNFINVSIQMPNGDTPLNNVRVPATTPVENGILDDRQKMMITLPIQQGGHVVLSCTETGTCLLMYRVTYSPA